MKIKKSSPKRLAKAPSNIQSLINSIMDCNENNLAVFLDAITSWTLPKSDFFHWMHVIDKFDATLEAIIQKLELTSSFSLQGLTKLTGPIKAQILSILRFTKLLFENCTNRSIYNSYDRLNSLLLCGDLSIIELTLRILLKPAQKLSSQRSIRNNFCISNENLLVLASNWGLKEYKLELVDVASSDCKIPDAALEFKHQFYRSQAADKSMKRSESAEGLVSIYVDNVLKSGSQLHEVLDEMITKYQVNQKSLFSLFHKLRISFSLNNLETRRQLLVIKFLAISVLGYLNEDSLLNSIFLYEPTLIEDLSNLLHPDRLVEWTIRTAALSSLESISKIKSKMSEVLSSLNASANHGVMTYIFRKILASMESSADLEYPVEFTDALFSLIAHLVTSQSGGDALISAGLVQTFVKFLAVKDEKYFKIVTRCIAVLDNLIYGFPNSFNVFCSADGVPVLTDRIKYEVHYAIDHPNLSATEVDPNHAEDSLIRPLERGSLIKAALKFVLHMMQISGTADGLRNLIDGPIPSLLTEILSKPTFYGPNLFAVATNILSTFIHNEPTMLSAIQELGIPRVFLQAITSKIPISTEVLAALPNAFSALCLNSQGLADFTEFKPLEKFIMTLIDSTYLKALEDGDIPAILGTSIDEFIRHQPTLKNDVFNGIMVMLDGLESSSNDLIEKSEGKLLNLCRLQLGAANEEVLEVKMAASFPADENKDLLVANIITKYIENISKFLEGIFQHQSHCKEFIALGGVERLLKIYKLSSLPYDFASSSSSYSLSHLFRVIAEVNNGVPIPAVINEMLPSLQKCSPFLQYSEPESLFCKFVDLLDSASVINEAQFLFRNLITLHGYIGLLSDLYCSQSYSLSRMAVTVIQGFTTEDGEKLLRELNRLYRSCIWEYHIYKRTLPKSWLKSKKEAQANELIVDPSDRRIQNARQMKFLLSQIPTCIIPLISGIGKMLYSRRTMDTQKEGLEKISSIISSIINENLTWSRPTSLNERIIRQNYYSILFGQMNVLFFDSSSPHRVQLQCYPVISFVTKINGLENLKYCFKKLLDDQKYLNQEDEDEVQSYGTALENLLQLFDKLVDSDTLQQSNDILTHVNFTESDFVSYDYLIKVRYHVLDCVVHLWKNRQNFVKSLKWIVLCLNLIVEGNHEYKADTDETSKPTENISSSLIQAIRNKEPLPSGFVLERVDTSDTVEYQAMQILSSSTENIRESYYALRNIFKTVLVSDLLGNLNLFKEVINEVGDLLTLMVKSDLKAIPKILDAINTADHDLFFRILTCLCNDAVLQVELMPELLSRYSSLFEILEKHSKQTNNWNEVVTPIVLLLNMMLSHLETPLEEVKKVTPEKELTFETANDIETNDQPPIDVNAPPVYSDDAKKLMSLALTDDQSVRLSNLLISFLERDDVKENLIGAILRCLVCLTRNSRVCSVLNENPEFFKSILSSIQKMLHEDHYQSAPSLINIILRHLIEDKITMESVMHQDVISKFYPRHRSLDLKFFITNNDSCILRNSAAFLETISKICIFTTHRDDNYQVALNPKTLIKLEEEKPVEASFGSATELKTIESEENIFSPKETSSLPSTLLSLILNEIIASKTEEQGYQAQVIEDTVNAELQSKIQKVHYYRCFLLQCLSELIMSYPICAHQMVLYSERNGFINYLLKELIPYGGVTNTAARENLKLRRSLYESHWASYVLASMCSEDKFEIPNNENLNLQILPTDATNVKLSKQTAFHRNFAIGALGKAMKEALNMDESAEIKYGRYFAYSDLIHRILNSTQHFQKNSGNNAPANAGAETALSIAQSMIEKKYVSLLTLLIGDVDLHHPNAKTIVNAILRPLESLSRLSNKISLKKDTPATAPLDDLFVMYQDLMESTGMDVGEDEGSVEDENEDHEMDDVDMEEGDDIDDDELGEFDGLSMDEEQDDEDDDEDEDEDSLNQDGNSDEDEDMDIVIRPPHEHGLSEDEIDEEEDVEEVEANANNAEGDADQEEEDHWEIDDHDEHVEELDEFDNVEQNMGDDDQEADEDDEDDDDDEEEEEDVDDEDEEGHHMHEFVSNDENIDRRARTTIQRILDSARHGTETIDIQWHSGLGNNRTLSEDYEANMLESPFGNVNPANISIQSHPLITSSARPSQSTPTGITSTTVGLNATTDTNDFGVPHRSITTNQPLDILGRNTFQLIEQIIQRNHLPGLSNFPYIEVSHKKQSPNGEVKRDELFFASKLNFLNTNRRWWQEYKLIFGANTIPKANKIANSIIRVIEAVTVEYEKTKKEEEEKEALEKQKEKEKAEEVAEPEAEKKDEEVVAAESESMNIETEAAAAPSQVEETVATSANQDQANSAMEESPAVETVPEPIVTENIATSEAQPTTGITETIEEMAIEEDPGIDPTFLEALPVDLRREVLTQYFDERYRGLTNPPRLSQQFIDALPASIRDDVLRQQELAQQRHAEDQEAEEMEDVNIGPVDMDAASFFASLEPELRQQILMEQDESFLNQLPASIVAEANLLREREQRRAQQNRFRQSFRNALLGEMGNQSSLGISTSTGANPVAPVKKVNKDAIQIVDRTGILTLTRLIFLPDALNKKILMRLFGNLCHNGKTCDDIVYTMLTILKDGNVDFQSLEKNMLMSPNRRMSTPKRKQNNVKAFQTTLEKFPLLVPQRCLEVLLHLTNGNSRILALFLKENDMFELNLSSKKKSKKGYCQHLVHDNFSVNVISKLPLVMVLCLLEKPHFLQQSILLELMLQLLSVVVAPIEKIVEKRKLTETAKNPSQSIDDMNDSNNNLSEAGPSSAPSTSQINNSTTADNVNTNTNTNTAINEAPMEAEGTSTLADKLIESSGLKPSLSNMSLSNRPLPVIPDHAIKIFISTLAHGVLTKKAFNHGLSVVENLCLLPGAKDVISKELILHHFKHVLKPYCADLNVLLSILLSKSNTDVEIQGVTLDRFSSNTCAQAKLLKILKMVSNIYKKPKAESSSDEDVEAIRKDEIVVDDFVKEAYQTEEMVNAWKKLSECLSRVDDRPELFHVATVLLPSIESVFIVCRHFGVGKPGTTSGNAFFSEMLNKFTEEHRKLLNLMIRNTPSLLNENFSLLVMNSKNLDFDNKRSYFKQQLQKRKREQYGSFNLNVRRPFVFEDSFHQIMGRTGEELKYGKLNVRFYDEEGIDAGGVTREWFAVLSRQMFNADYALFRTSAVDKTTYQPNRMSGINPDHLMYFRFVGRIIGKAIYDGKILDCYFTRSFYKHILGIPVDLKDVEAFDPDFYKSLVWILENDITDILELTFSMETDDFGKRKIVDLIPNGRNIAVTNENKKEYVKSITEMKLTKAIEEQISSFKKGFYEVISFELISIFNEQELELLISGLPDIDVDDWKNNTEYQGYTSASPQIQWFWRAVRNFSQEERAKLIQFVTGTSKVPLEGFKVLQGSSGIQKFQIHKDFGSTERLPSAHTCFNQLDLPEYETYEILRKRLSFSMSECTGFGFS